MDVCNCRYGSPFVITNPCYWKAAQITEVNYRCGDARVTVLPCISLFKGGAYVNEANPSHDRSQSVILVKGISYHSFVFQNWFVFWTVFVREKWNSVAVILNFRLPVTDLEIVSECLAIRSLEKHQVFPSQYWVCFLLLFLGFSSQLFSICVCLFLRLSLHE